MGHKEHVDEIEEAQSVQDALDQGVQVEAEDAQVQHPVLCQTAGVLHKVEHGYGQQHKGVEGDHAGQGRKIALRLGYGRIGSAPDGADEQEGGHMEEAGVPHPNPPQIEGHAQGTDGQDAHDEHDGEVGGRAGIVLPGDGAAAADIDHGETEMPACGVLIPQGQNAVRRVGGEAGVAVQLGLHLVVAGEKLI